MVASLYAYEGSGGAAWPAAAAGGAFLSSATMVGRRSSIIFLRSSGVSCASDSTSRLMPTRRPLRGFIRMSSSAASSRSCHEYLSCVTTATSLSGPCSVVPQRWTSFSLTTHETRVAPAVAMTAAQFNHRGDHCRDVFLILVLAVR